MTPPNSTSGTHIVTSFADELNSVESLLLEMGALVEDQLRNATQALRSEDRDLAKSVLRNDGRINDLEAEINDTALRILALRQPVAIDLRTVVMSVKIARHLERVGDYAKNMARRTNTITKAEAFTGSVGTMARMSELVQAMVRNALDAYGRRDAALAEQVRVDDEQVDLMHNTVFEKLVNYMMAAPENVGGAIHLLLIARNLERMGDHVADVAMETIYMVTGEWPQTKRPKGDRTSRMILELDPDADPGDE